MRSKFRKSEDHTVVSPQVEIEVLDAYAEILDASSTQDLFLKDMPVLLTKLQIPECFTQDIAVCIKWIYSTKNITSRVASPNWAAAEQLLRHLTLSVYADGNLEVSDNVDIDKLIKFCGWLLKFRDNYESICEKWELFVEAAGGSTSDISKQELSLQDLIRVKRRLQLDDIHDSILIDMIGCGRSSAEGELFNYKLSTSALSIGIKDFAEILGRLGELN